MAFRSLTRHMECLARDYPNKLALVSRGRHMTYGELNRRANVMANALIDMGIRKGDKVALVNSNGPETLESMYAIEKTGGVLVPISPLLKGDALRLMLDESDSLALICGQGLTGEIHSLRAGLPKIRKDRLICTGSTEIPGYVSYERIMETYSGENPGVEFLPQDMAKIAYSSGTTGCPKGVIHTHDFQYSFAVNHALSWRVGFESTVCTSTPLYHTGGVMLTYPALLVGGTVVLMEKFDAKEWLELVQKEKVTHAFLVPTQFIIIMQLPEFSSYDIRSLEIIITAAAPITRKTKEEILANFRCQVAELYGLTEGIATILRPMDQLRKLGSVGKATLGGEIRVVDNNMKDVARGEIGEIIGLNPEMKGYYKNPELTAQTFVNGWVRTGDLGKLDEDGYLYLVGRKKDMIISGGVNIYPEDIEQVMARHPKVLEVSVFGIPHEKWGETPRAAVILKEGLDCSEEELLEWTNAKLARYQRISGVDFVKDMPRTPAGKVQKVKLRAPYWEGWERDI